MIIGISGKKRSGKDTVADFLIQEYGFIKYGFADPIKQIAKIIFGFNEEQLYGDKKEEIDKIWKIKPRIFSKNSELIMDSLFFQNIFQKYLKMKIKEVYGF